MEEFTEMLLKSLMDENIRKQIIEITNEGKKRGDDRWKSEVERMELLLNEEQIKSHQMEKLINSQREEARRINQELERENEKLVQQLKKAEEIENYYQNNFEKMEKQYQSYLLLDSNIHKDLSRVLSIKSPEQFVCWGCQWGNIEALWEFMDIAITQKRCDQETIIILESIFDYFFELYRDMTGSYERIRTEVGEEFDEKVHKRSGESRVSGRISKVVLRGYQGIYNKKIQKSIVII